MPKAHGFTLRGKWLIAASCAVIIGAAILFIVNYLSPESRRAREALAFEERKYRQKAGFDGFQFEMVSADQADPQGMVELAEQLTPEVLMAEYRLIYRYPLSSRPLTPVMEDLLDPWTVHPVKKPVFRNVPPLEGEKPVYYFTWSAPTDMITGARPAVAKLTVYEPDSDTTVPIEISSAGVACDPVYGTMRVGDAHYTVDDKGSYTFTWVPEKGNRMHWGNLTLSAVFRAPDDGTYRVEMPFRSTPDPPAAFTGSMRDRLENGSLVIDVEINVMKEGQYIIEANLFEDGGKPLHWVYLNRYLEKGTQDVDLLFFGLVFHDQRFSGGRLVLRNLRGHRVNLAYDPRKLDEMLKRGQKIPATNQPEHEWMEPYDQDFVTSRSYDVDDFSRSEYEGKDKAERLEAIYRYKKTWEDAHGPAPE